MSKKGIPLESFNLDEREFERCKNWSALIKRYSIIDSGDEVDLENLESHYADGNDEEDESAEDLVEVDLEDEENEPSPLDQSVIQMRIFSSTLLQGKESCYKNFKYSGSKLMVPLPEEEEVSGEGEEDQCEMQNILDQTIPKLEERKRKWKESGMLRVLNTFDEERIERTVGSWLRVNNSRSVQPEKRTRTPQTQYDDEDDSLHSMETARYVLSNRKPRSSSNCHNTMTIKRFRLLQSKRDALREKYALPEDELDRIRAISKQKLRRHASDISTQLARFMKTKVIDKESAARKSIRASEIGRSCVKKRRKLLNKHRVGRCHLNQSSWDSSSSDEDFGDDGNDQCSKNPRKRHQRRLHRASHTPYCRRSQILTPLTFSSTISSMHSSTSDTETTSLICNQLELGKPKKRASECCCYNKKKLCHQIDHLADTSTEDWLVENCDSPKKLVSIGEVKNPVQPIKKQKSTSKIKARKNEKCIRNNKNAELIGFNEKDIHETEENKQGEESGNNAQLDSTFERDLKLAVELSKESYKAEMNQLKDEEYIDRKAKKTKARKVKNKKKSTVEDNMTSIKIKANSKREPKEMSTKLDKKSSTNGPTDSLIDQKATAVDQSKEILETFEKSCKKNPEIQEIVIKPNANVAERNENVFLNAALVIHEISPTHFGIKPQPKSLKIKKVKKILEKSGNAKQKEEETFFTRADKICNSTAVPDDTAALKKQFPTVADTPSEESTKPKTLFHDEVTTTKMDGNKGATVEDDADDCFLVSSTTEEPQQKAEAAAIVTNNRSNNSNEGMKDIMLYTPRCRDLAPMSSISDGVFNITEEHLSTFIGTKSARKFMKYYIGRRRFDANLTVYYRPPRDNCLDCNNDTDSDVEELEQLNRYGELYASFEKEKQ